MPLLADPGTHPRHFDVLLDGAQQGVAEEVGDDVENGADDVGVLALHHAVAADAQHEEDVLDQRRALPLGRPCTAATGVRPPSPSTFGNFQNLRSSQIIGRRWGFPWTF